MRLLALAASFVACAHAQQYTYVRKSATGGFSLSSTPDPVFGSPAWGTFEDAIETTGWSFMTVFSNESWADMDQAFGAGFLEGAMATQRIWETAFNQGLMEPLPPTTQQWLDLNTEFMNASLQLYSSSDPYWYHVSLILQQVNGIAAGYAAAQTDPTKFLSAVNITALNLPGDLQDLLPGAMLERLNREAAAGLATEADAELQSLRATPARHSTMAALRALSHRIARNSPAAVRAGAPAYKLLPPPSIATKLSHCSALVRLTNTSSSSPSASAQELYIGHASWSGAETMTRTWKQYTFPWRLLPNEEARVPAVVSSFSGYPGQVVSSDDFYQLQPSNLALVETTIGNNNNTLYELYMKPESVLEWLRNLVANRLATDGPSWADVFSRYNSGTYNDEWLVVDYKLFTPGAPLPPHTLTVLDQVPGFISIVDQTPLLQSRGYFASYNDASDPFIFNISGWYATVEQYGDYMSYDKCPRALIFGRDAPGVNDTDSMATIMRYNDYTHDPFSREGCGSNPPYYPAEAIACRADLAPVSGDWTIPFFGLSDNVAVDAKFTSASMMAGKAPALSPSFMQQKHEGVYGSGAGAAGAAAAPLALPVMYALAQSGPSHDIQPAFDWRTTALNTFNLSHLGMPDVWDFGWVTVATDTSGATR